MELGRALERAADAQAQCVIVGFADDLNPDRQTAATDPEGSISAGSPV